MEFRDLDLSYLRKTAVDIARAINPNGLNLARISVHDNMMKFHAITRTNTIRSAAFSLTIIVQIVHGVTVVDKRDICVARRIPLCGGFRHDQYVAVPPRPSVPLNTVETGIDNRLP